MTSMTMLVVALRQREQGWGWRSVVPSPLHHPIASVRVLNTAWQRVDPQ